ATGIPWVNRLVDAVRSDIGLTHGVAVPVCAASQRERLDLASLAEKAAAGGVTFTMPSHRDRERAITAAHRAVAAGVRTIDRNRRTRDRLIGKLGDPAFP